VYLLVTCYLEPAAPSKKGFRGASDSPESF
jgi:hypothetical protein